MKMLFSGFRASLKAKAPRPSLSGNAGRKTVAERRTVLYNQVVTSYHKAKIERAALARELEAVKAEAARVPQLEEDLRIARAQCAESEEAGRAAAAKLRVADGELTRLRKLEANHLKELAALRKAEEEKVEGLSKRLEEVDRRRTSPRGWGRSVLASTADLAKLRVSIFGLRQSVLAGRRRSYLKSPSSGEAIGSCRLPICPNFGISILELTTCFSLQQPSLAQEARCDGRQGGERGQAAGSELGCFSMDHYTASMAAASSPSRSLAGNSGKAVEEAIGCVAARRCLGTLPTSSTGCRWADVEENLPAENKTARLARACAIADFVDKRIFIEDPNPPSDDEDEAEDDADAPEAVPAAGNADAPPGGPDPAGA
ncbi:hypothetical protein QYE76_033594 [Lolium multiflorum]|uniref:Uncharacterized protein n=1 Tax=Lolium multiflorum TaxID=4521 RepID=A0AAD8VLN1_LOLMU|nr:hypothetical protein QYE76_033594 [Lolium multiflorum]